MAHHEKSQTFYGFEHHVALGNQDFLLLCVAMSTLAVIVLLQQFLEPKDVKAPTEKFYGQLVPNIFSRLRFNSSAPTVIYAGYKKVSAEFLYQIVC